MYKPKLDESCLEKGYSLVQAEDGRIMACNLFRFDDEILEEIKKYPLKIISFEASCNLSDFKFLNYFSSLENIQINTSHQKVHVNDFNNLNGLISLGLPQFSGVFSNAHIKNIGFCWGEGCSFSKENLGLNQMTVQNCNNLPSLMKEISFLSNLESLNLLKCKISDFTGNSVMNSVRELKLQYCNISSMKSICEVFPDCRSLTIEHTKGFSDYEVLCGLCRLESLTIVSATQIDDLTFLSKFSYLKTLKIISTKINSSSFASIKNIPDVVFYGTGNDSL